MFNQAFRQSGFFYQIEFGPDDINLLTRGCFQWLKAIYHGDGIRRLALGKDIQNTRYIKAGKAHGE